MIEALERKQLAAAAGIEMSEEDRRVAYEELTLLSPPDDQPVLKELSISIPFGSRTLVSGCNETGKVALFRATAGLWTSGKGRIIRPAVTDIYFLAERPYLLPPGTLREVLVRTKLEHSIADGQIRDLLHELDLDPVLVRAGGLNIEQDWGTLLSLGEQQLLALIHILLASPHFVFLDRAGTALNSGQVRKILKMLSTNSITYVNIGESDDLRDLYDAVWKSMSWDVALAADQRRADELKRILQSWGRGVRPLWRFWRRREARRCHQERRWHRLRDGQPTLVVHIIASDVAKVADTGKKFKAKFVHHVVQQGASEQIVRAAESHGPSHCGTCRQR